jgi:hypothetical protein
MLRICAKYGTETHAMKKLSRLKENRGNLQGSMQERVEKSSILEVKGIVVEEHRL